jgi:hypothetical protein
MQGLVFKPGFIDEHVEVAAAGTVYGVNSNAQFGFFDLLPIDPFADRFHIRRARIELGNFSRLVFEAIRQVVQIAHDFVRDFDCCRSGVIRNVFDAAVFRRIVACGEHQSARGRLSLRRPGDNRRRHILRRHAYFDTHADQNFSSAAREAISEKAGVVADQHWRLLSAFVVSLFDI